MFLVRYLFTWTWHGEYPLRTHQPFLFFYTERPARVAIDTGGHWRTRAVLAQDLGEGNQWQLVGTILLRRHRVCIVRGLQDDSSRHAPRILYSAQLPNDD